MRYEQCGLGFDTFFSTFFKQYLYVFTESRQNSIISQDAISRASLGQKSVRRWARRLELQRTPSSSVVIFVDRAALIERQFEPCHGASSIQVIVTLHMTLEPSSEKDQCAKGR